jgi:hypothetical protein
MAVTLNGTSFPNVKVVTEEPVKVGVMHEAINGDSNWLHRANKGRWTLTWENVDLTTRNNVRAVFNLTGAFAFVDPEGNSYTVLCEPNGYNATPEMVGSNAFVYTITLKIRQK